MNVSRLLIHQFRRVLRRAGIKSTRRSAGPLVRFQTGPNGLSIQAYSATTAVEFRQPGELPAAEFQIPLPLLAECEAKDSSQVSFANSAEGQTTLTWSSRGTEQVRTVEAAATSMNAWQFPPNPESFVQNPRGLFKALATAAEICECRSTRFVLDCVQLRAEGGKIIATDGHQLLVQSGWQFPWTGDLLIPRPLVLGAPELSHDRPVEIGQTKNWLSLVSDPWTIHILVQKHGRFPKVESCVPSTLVMPSRLELSEHDSQILVDRLPGMPGANDDFCPIVVDLNGQVLIRAQDESQPQGAELNLTSSVLHGKPIRFRTNRQFLTRAIRLGFRDFYFSSAAAPAACSDGNRQYVWMLLGEPERRQSDGHANVHCSESESPPGDQAGAVSMASNVHFSQSLDVKKAEPMPKEATNDTEPNDTQTTASDTPVATVNLSSIDRAIALRDALRDCLAKTHELIQHLRLHQRQSKLVASTIESLKQLQTAG